MAKKGQNLTWEIYHKIYRLAVKGVRPQSIATTLSLPLKTVNNILDRLYKSKNMEGGILSIKKQMEREGGIPGEEKNDGASFLDIFVSAKIRYSIVDLSGMLTAQYADKLAEELDNLFSSPLKAIAIRMLDIENIDNEGFGPILNFHNKFINRGRYSAILDPSPAVESFIEKNKIDEKIDIFGTEKAFEENAFSISGHHQKRQIK